MNGNGLRTSVGWRTISGRRALNEDAVLAARLPDGRELLAIADGMGGHNAGEVASQRAVQTIFMALQRGAGLRAAVIEANAAIYRAAHENEAWRGMGTTIVALLRSDAAYEIASVGDSRAYRVTSDGVQQITRDHCVLSEAIAAGSASVNAVRESRWRDALTRSLGGEASVEVDVFGPFEMRQPHVALLCTDGLHRSVGEAVMQRCVLENGGASAAAQRLCEAAYSGGSTDNITAAIMIFDESVTTSVAMSQPGYPPDPFAPRTYPILMPEPRQSGSLLRRLMGGR